MNVKALLSIAVIMLIRITVKDYMGSFFPYFDFLFRSANQTKFLLSWKLDIIFINGC